jgi:thioredoxin-dependent peroxiredoxin
MGTEERVVLEAGREAPEIVATVTGGGAFRLSEHRGRWVVVYFYPRANTPG